MMTILKEIFSDLRFIGFCASIAAFLISTKFYLYPDIINISKIKGLMDDPDERKMHTSKTPTLGGLGVFIAFSLCTIIFAVVGELEQPDLVKLLGVIGSTIILLFLGIKDDLISIPPKNKFLGQLLAVLNVVILTDVRIMSFEGLLGIGELPYIVSILFSVFVFVLVINALNLIDGIDGLAASISIISSISFGILFLVNGYYLMTLISAILIGALLGFLRYNLSNKQKIFMGDCGSMLIGFLLSYQGVAFLALNGANDASSAIITNGPIVLLAILSYPLFDLLRVFAIRIKQKRSPFSADSNHIHHRLLRLGLSHKKATLLLSIGSALVIGSTFLLTNLNIHFQLLITVGIGVFLYLLPFLSVFETTIDLTTLENESEKEVKVLDMANSTFNFNLNPIDFFNQNGYSTNGSQSKEIELISDLELDEEQDIDLISNSDITHGHLHKKELIKKRIMAKRVTQLKKQVKKS